MTATHDLYEPVVLEFTFRNAAGALADPTTVTAMVMSPSGLVAEYPAAGDIVHPSTGLYQIAYLPDEWGPWPYRAEGVGNDVNVVQEGVTWVEYSYFAETLAGG
jgi:hypothetical protein